MIPKRIKRMPEPFRTLLLMAPKETGIYDESALAHVEEQLTAAECDKAVKFFAWLREHNLGYGYGTIDLRYHEFVHRLTPVPRDEAHKWAMKAAGL